jgi:lipopolysaccharide transport system ATP-binding protein
LQDLSKRQGRTVLLVSHNAAALVALCQRGVLIDHGRVRFDGGIHDALHQYLQGSEHAAGTEWTGPSGDEHLRLMRAWVRPVGDAERWDSGRPIEIGATVDVLQTVEGLVFGMRLLSEFGAELAYVQFDDAEGGLPPAVTPCRFDQVWTIPANSLAAGQYRVSFELGLAHRQVSHKQPEGDLTFTVENLTGPGRRFPMAGIRGYNSLFRPDWPTQHRRQPLPDDRA